MTAERYVDVYRQEHASMYIYNEIGQRCLPAGRAGPSAHELGRLCWLDRARTGRPGCLDRPLRDVLLDIAGFER